MTARVFYIDGRVRCPLAGIGTRAATASNRLVVDDPATSVTIETRTVTLRDDRDCAPKTVIADLVWLAEGTDARGMRARFTIHLEVIKTGHGWAIDLHTHEPTPLVRSAFTYEPIEIVAIDSGNREVLVDASRLARAVQHVPLSRRIGSALVALRDHPRSSGTVVDRSIGIGALGRGMFLVRAKLASLDGVRRETDPSALLSTGAWELSLEALTDRWMPALVQRDLVLYELADHPLLAPIRDRGLRSGQTLAFRIGADRSVTTGEVRLDDRTAPLENALDIARTYLEFHMLGGVLCAAIETR